MHVGVSFGKNSLLISFLAFCSSLIHWFTSSSLISIWLTKFIAKCKEALIVSSSDTNKLVGKVKDILSIYTNSDQTFFTIFQLTWIIVLYLGVSAYFSKYEPQFTLLFGVGPLFSPLWIRAMSSIMEDASLAVKDLVTPWSVTGRGWVMQFRMSLA